MSDRYITLFRKPAPDFLHWDYHVSEDEHEVALVIAHIKEQGVWQWHTYPLGSIIPELSQQPRP